MIVYTVIEDHNSSAEQAEVRGVFGDFDEACAAVYDTGPWGLRSDLEGIETYWRDNTFVIVDASEDHYWRVEPWTVEA